MDISKQSQERIDDLKSIPAAARFEKIAVNLENPQLYRQFLEIGAEADIKEIVDYAYAAGLISKADAEKIKQEEDEKDVITLIVDGFKEGDDGEGIAASVWTTSVDNTIIEKINNLTEYGSIKVLIDGNKWIDILGSNVEEVITIGYTQNVIINGLYSSNPYDLPDFIKRGATIIIEPAEEE